MLSMATAMETPRLALMRFARPELKPAANTTTGVAYPTHPSTSPSVGKSPVAFLEKARRPSTRISKTPPPDFFSVTAAPGLAFWIAFCAARARPS